MLPLLSTTNLLLLTPSRLQSCKVTQLAPLQRHYNAWPCSLPCSAKPLPAAPAWGRRLGLAIQRRSTTSATRQGRTFPPATSPAAAQRRPPVHPPRIQTTWATSLSKRRLWSNGGSVDTRTNTFSYSSEGIDLIKAYDRKWSARPKQRLQLAPRGYRQPKRGGRLDHEHLRQRWSAHQHETSIRPHHDKSLRYEWIPQQNNRPRNHPNEFIHVHQWPRLDAYDERGLSTTNLLDAIGRL